MHPPSNRKLAPLGQGSGAVLLEDVAAVEMAVLVELVVKRGMDGSELLNLDLARNQTSLIEWRSLPGPPFSFELGPLPGGKRRLFDGVA